MYVSYTCAHSAPAPGMISCQRVKNLSGCPQPLRQLSSLGAFCPTVALSFGSFAKVTYSLIFSPYVPGVFSAQGRNYISKPKCLIKFCSQKYMWPPSPPPVVLRHLHSGQSAVHAAEGSTQLCSRGVSAAISRVPWVPPVGFL